MSTLEQAQELLAAMTLGEKAQMLEWIVQDLDAPFPGIESTPGVLGGEPRILRTRIPVWAVIQLHNLGATDAEVLRCYPSLRAADLTNAQAYYLAHKAEIDQQIVANETA